MTIVFAVAALICAAGWLVTRISLLSVITWLIKKGYTPPSQEETLACSKEVVRKMFGLKS